MPYWADAGPYALHGGARRDRSYETRGVLARITALDDLDRHPSSRSRRWRSPPRNVHLDYGAHAFYVGAGVAVFVLVDRLLYVHLDDTRYRRLFAVFLFVSGCLLIYKAFAP